MSLIAEFRFHTPILRGALEAVPEMRLRIETVQLGPENQSRILFWAAGDDFEAFERGLDADETIRQYRCLTEVDGQRLYRTSQSDTGEEVLTYPVMAQEDINILNGTGTTEGWTIRARFPDREALSAYREACQERDIPFRVQRLYPEAQIVGDGGGSDPYGLTDPQREVLLATLEMGYFDVPRQTTLDDIAQELGITVQAVSTRLRRAQQTLVRNTVSQ